MTIKLTKPQRTVFKDLLRQLRRIVRAYHGKNFFVDLTDGVARLTEQQRDGLGRLNRLMDLRFFLPEGTELTGAEVGVLTGAGAYETWQRTVGHRRKRAALAA